jgi:hypothetical protein
MDTHGHESDGKVGYTTGSTTDAAGNLYVTNFSSNPVAEYDSIGEPSGRKLIYQR